MNKIQYMLSKYPRYSLCTQYAPVEGGMNSVVSFFNYFDQIFRGSNTEATLHLIFLNKNGDVVAERAILVPANGSIKFNAVKEGIKSDGMVVVAAIPEHDIDSINLGFLKLKSLINTGFYIKWENTQGGRDMMHEWTSVQTKPTVLSKHHVGIKKAQIDIDHGLILMNPVATKGSVSLPTLVLRESGCSEELNRVKLDPIPPLGTRVIRFSSLFDDFHTLLKSGKVMVVDIEAENLSPPFSAEWHEHGDFHFHHI